MQSLAIKLYFGDLLGDKKSNILLSPFFDRVDLEKDDPDFGRFDEWRSSAKHIYSIVDSGIEADAFILPYEFEFTDECFKDIRLLESQARSLNRPFLIFFNSDNDSEIPFDYPIIFRTSFYRSLRKQNEYAFPGWSVDFLNYYDNKLQVRSKRERPVVGYCGYVDFLQFYSLIHRIKYFWKRISYKNRDGFFLRGCAVRKFLANNSIESNFLIRSGFWAPEESNKMKARIAYTENIFNSDYVIVCRGGGNFSYRFYEVLSCGRIPVFINTDSVLPFDDMIDWRSYCVWIEADEIHNIDNIVLNFHKNLSDKAFKDLQRQIRRIYEEWIAPAAFFEKISLYFKDREEIIS